METKKIKKMKIFALIGILGGLTFSIGDMLVFLIPHYLTDGMYNDFANMNIWRLAFSTYLGVIGSFMLLLGYLSLYNIVKENCLKLTKLLVLFVGFSITLTPLGHFIIAILSNMTFKLSVNAGTSFEIAKAISKGWLIYLYPIKIFIMLTIILIQSILSIGLILSGKIICPKWLVICNPLFMVIISIPLLIILKGKSFIGITEGLESLGEGIIYISVYYHWNYLYKKIVK